MFDLIGQVWPVKVLVCVLLLVEYMQHKHLALPHFLNPVCNLRLAPCLLSTSGSFALTKTYLGLAGLRCATMGALVIHSFTSGFL